MCWAWKTSEFLWDDFPKKGAIKKKKRSSRSFHGKAIMKIPKFSQLSQYVSRLNHHLFTVKYVKSQFLSPKSLG